MMGNNSDDSELPGFYWVDIIPDPHYGLGIKLDEQAFSNEDDEMSRSNIKTQKRIYISSFKRHTITKEAMAAEKSGKIDVGDELVAINDINCFRSSMTFVIPTVRNILQATPLGQPIRIKLLRAPNTLVEGTSASIGNSPHVIIDLTSHTLDLNNVLQHGGWMDKLKSNLMFSGHETPLSIQSYQLWTVNVNMNTLTLHLLYVVLTYRKAQNEARLKLFSSTYEYPSDRRGPLHVEIDEIVCCKATLQHTSSPIASSYASNTVTTPATLRLINLSERSWTSSTKEEILRVDIMDRESTKVLASYRVRGIFAAPSHSLQLSWEVDPQPVTVSQIPPTSGSNKWQSAMDVSSHSKCLQALSSLRTRFLRQSLQNSNHGDDSDEGEDLDGSSVSAGNLSTCPFVSSAGDMVASQPRHVLHLVSALQCPRFRDPTTSPINTSSFQAHSHNQFTKIVQQLLSLSSSNPNNKHIAILPSSHSARNNSEKEVAPLAFPHLALSPLAHDYLDRIAHCINDVSVYYIVQSLEGKNTRYRPRNYSVVIGHYRYTPFALLTIFLLHHSLHEMLSMYGRLAEAEVSLALVAPPNLLSTSNDVASSTAHWITQFFDMISCQDAHTTTLLWDWLFQLSWRHVLTMLNTTLHSKSIDLQNVRQITKKFAKKVKVSTFGVKDDEDDDDSEDEEEECQKNFASDLQRKEKEKIRKIQPNNVTACQVVNLFFCKAQKQMLELLIGYVYKSYVHDNNNGNTMINEDSELVKKRTAILHTIGYHLFQTSQHHSSHSTVQDMATEKEKERWQAFHDQFASPSVDILSYAASLKLSFWLFDLGPLLDTIHAYALQQFKVTKSSMKIFLEMVLIGKRDQLLLLAKADGSTTGRQLLHLLNTVEEALDVENDDEDKLTDLQNFLRKNAFALMRKQRYRDAVAVFLLFPTTSMLKAAQSLLVQQCSDPFLAHLVLRIVEFRTTSYRLYFPGGTSQVTMNDEVKTIYCHDTPALSGKFTRDLLEKDILPAVMEAALDLPEEDAGAGSEEDVAMYHGLQGFSACLFALVVGLWCQSRTLLQDIFRKVFPLLEKYLLHYDTKEVRQLLPDAFFRVFSAHLAEQQSAGHSHSQEHTKKLQRIVLDCALVTFGQGIPTLHHYQQLLNSLWFLWECTLFADEAQSVRMVSLIDAFLHKHHLHEAQLQFVEMFLRLKDLQANTNEKTMRLQQNTWFVFMKDHCVQSNRARDAVAKFHRTAADATAANNAASNAITAAGTVLMEAPKKTFNFSTMSSTSSSSNTTHNMLDDAFAVPAASRASTTPATINNNLMPAKSALDMFDMPPPRPTTSSNSSSSNAKDRPKSALEDFDQVYSRPARKQPLSQPEEAQSTLSTPSPTLPASAPSQPAAVRAVRSALDDLDPAPRRVQPSSASSSSNAAGVNQHISRSTKLVSGEPTASTATATLPPASVVAAQQGSVVAVDEVFSASKQNNSTDNSNNSDDTALTIPYVASDAPSGEKAITAVENSDSSPITSNVPITAIATFTTSSISANLSNHNNIDNSELTISNNPNKTPSAASSAISSTSVPDIATTATVSSSAGGISSEPRSLKQPPPNPFAFPNSNHNPNRNPNNPNHITSSSSSSKKQHSQPAFAAPPTASNNSNNSNSNTKSVPSDKGYTGNHSNSSNPTNDNVTTTATNEVTPSRTLSDRLRDFYALHNPEKLNSIPEILEKYKGKEKELFNRLQKQYQTTTPI